MSLKIFPRNLEIEKVWPQIYKKRSKTLKNVVYKIVMILNLRMPKMKKFFIFCNRYLKNADILLEISKYTL